MWANRTERMRERRKLRSSTLLLSFLLLLSQALAAERIDTRKLQQFRVNLPQVRIQLRPTPISLTPDMLDNIHNAIGHVTSDEFAAEDDSFRYLLWGDLLLDYSEEASVITLPSGIASFGGLSEAEGPSSETMWNWMERGILANLVDELHKKPGLEFIQKATLLLNQNQQDKEESTVSVGRTASSSSRSSDLPMIMGVAVTGAAAMLLLLAAFVTHRRKNKLKEASLNGTLNSSQVEARPDDNHSLADSFTVRTEDGGASAAPPPIVRTESFQKDRKLHVQKDMLTSPWSGRLPQTKQVAAESVLQPSYFVAAHERHNLEQQQQQTMVFQSPHDDEKVFCETEDQGTSTNDGNLV